ncbi:MAG: VCBS repeat-containing protein, partial [Draconibacterium sp.]|nr:VCBS repeat-containing protein [Draconibacterium sp.]
MKSKLIVFKQLALLILLLGCGPAEELPIDFQLIEGENIVLDSGFSQGAAWGDFDNDGHEDLFVTNSWTNGNNYLYKNNGDGTFESIANVILSNDGGNSNGCSWGDLDNDGDLDLFVANVNNQNNFLYLNSGNGSFEKLKSADAATDGGWTYTGSWTDFNNDGWLDLFVGNYKEQSNYLYQNDGSGNLIRIDDSEISKEKKSTQG